MNLLVFPLKKPPPSGKLEYNYVFKLIISLIFCLSLSTSIYFHFQFSIYRDKENGRFCTPASSKPLSRTQTKSTIKKTRFVTPSCNRNMTVRQSTSQCDKKSPGRTVNVADTSVEASGKNENAKSYKDKSLEMR